LKTFFVSDIEYNSCVQSNFQTMPNTFEVFKGCNHYQGRKGTEIVYRNPLCRVRPVSEEDFDTFKDNILTSLPFISSFQAADGRGPHCEMETIHITPENSLLWFNRCLKPEETSKGKKIILLVKGINAEDDPCDWTYYKIAVHDQTSNKIMLRTLINTGTTRHPTGKTGDDYISSKESEWKIFGKKKTAKVTADKVFWQTLAYKLNEEEEVKGEIIVIGRY